MKFGNKHKQYSLLKKGTVVHRPGRNPTGFIIEEPFRLRPKDAYMIKIMTTEGRIWTTKAQNMYAFFASDNGYYGPIRFGRQPIMRRFEISEMPVRWAR